MPTVTIHRMTCVMTFTALLFASSKASDAETHEVRDLVVGTVTTLESRHLQDSREIYVRVPDDYGTSTQRYPVLYSLDGQIYFHHGVGYANAFSQFDKTPEFIVVGIESKRPQRFGFFSSNEQAYRSFLEEDVFAYVEQRYRTTSERILFGWEYAGGFVLRWLAESPAIADGTIAASPFPVDQALVDSLGRQIDRGALKGKSLYFAFGDDEGGDGPIVKTLMTDLRQKASQGGPSWKFERLVGVHHNMTPHRALHAGMMHHYADYEWLHFSSLEDFDAQGGLDYATTYYAHRGKKYGLPASIHRQTMHNLALLALRGGHVNRFTGFLDNFEGFIEGTNHGWCNRFAAFLVENDRPSRALLVLDSAIERFTESASLQALRARALEGLGDLDNARTAWRQAIALAEQDGDDVASEYRSRLEALGENRP